MQFGGKMDRRKSNANDWAGLIKRKLESWGAIDPQELTLVDDAADDAAVTHAARSNIHGAARYIVSGWAAHMREFGDGRRQIHRLLLPGDALNPTFTEQQGHHVVQAVTAVQSVSGEAIAAALKQPASYPGLNRALRLAAAEERALLLEHAARLGRQNAYERTSHLFLELRHRCESIGMLQDNSIPFPLTQETMGDLLGLSVVHVNRTLQQMRRDGVVSLQQGRLTFLDVGALSRISEYQPPRLSQAA